MKKIIRYILGITSIVLFLGIVYSTLNYAQSEHQEKPYYLDLKARSVPLFCGETAYVFQTAFELFGEDLIAGAKVRKGAMADGDIVGILSFTYNEDRNTGTYMMTIPDTGETCILGYGTEWEFYNDILVEGNASKQ